MQNVLTVSRKIDYALRAMIYLATLPPAAVVPFREIARLNGLPEDFLAKILRSIADAGLLTAVRGSHGGYQLAKSPEAISFLDVIEAVEGPVRLNVCVDDEARVSPLDHDGCAVSGSCTMLAVWRTGQERMLEVYRSTSLRELATPRSVKLPTLPTMP